MNLCHDRNARRHLSRRQFSSVAGVAATSLLFDRSMQAAAVEPGYIDAHVHVWTPQVDQYPLDENYSRQDMQPPSFTPEQLFEHTRASGVDRIVLIQMSFYRYDNSYMLDMIADHPGVFAGVGIVDHDAEDLERQVKQLAQRGVRGFRIHSRRDLGDRRNDPAEWVKSAGMARLWEVATTEGLAICPLINPDDLTQVAQLCSRFPETTVVIDHFARVGISGTFEFQQLNALCDMARFAKVHVKTSAFYALGKKEPPYRDLLPMIRRVVDAFGPERLMWASDCPYQVQGNHNYEASIALIRDASPSVLSDQEKLWLLRGTAERLFFEN